MPKPKSAPVRVASAPTSTKKTKAKVEALVKAAKGASEADHKRAEALLAEIARRMGHIAEEFYDIGRALLELQKRKLFAALGYSSFAAMLNARKVMSVSTAHRLIRVVSSLPRDKALLVGSVKAELLVGYSEATPEPDTPEWLLEKGKLPSGKRVADASTREIEVATKAARKASGRTITSSDEVEARAHAREAQASLRKRGAKGATAEAVKKGGVWWVRVEVPSLAVGLLKG